MNLGIIILCALFLFFIVFVIISDKVFDVIDIIYHVNIKISSFFSTRKMKRTPYYKEQKIKKELSVSKYLDKLNIKDIEAHLRYFKLDEKTANTLNQFKISKIEIYLRSKKLKKLK